MTERQYLIVIEGNQEAGFSAYVPDLPGCVAAGKTRETVEREMHDVIAFHLEGLVTRPYPSGCGRSDRRGRTAASSAHAP